MTALSMNVSGPMLGFGAVILLVIGAGLGAATPAILGWFDEVIAGITELILKLIGWGALAAIIIGLLYLAGVRP